MTHIIPTPVVDTDFEIDGDRAEFTVDISRAYGFDVSGYTSLEPQFGFSVYTKLLADTLRFVEGRPDVKVTIDVTGDCGVEFLDTKDYCPSLASVLHISYCGAGLILAELHITDEEDEEDDADGRTFICHIFAINLALKSLDSFLEGK